MTATLRPMNLGEILDQTFQIYRAKFLAYAGIAAVPALAMIGLEIANMFWWHLHLQDTERISFKFTFADLVAMLVFYQISLLLHILVWPGFAYVTSKCCLDEQWSFRAAVFGYVGRWRGLLAMTAALWAAVLLLPELLSIGLLGGIFFLLYDGLKIDSPLLDKTGPFLFYFAAWAIILGLSAPLLFSISAWTLERLSVWSAMCRSWKLSKGVRLRIIFVRITTPVLGWVLNYALILLSSLLFRVILRNFGGRLFLYHHILGINFVAAAVASTIVGPIFPIALTLFYYDQRIRHEGYDIVKMMDAAGLNMPEFLPSKEVAIAPHKPEGIQA
jgi:hypothetical protein